MHNFAYAKYNVLLNNLKHKTKFSVQKNFQFELRLILSYYITVFMRVVIANAMLMSKFYLKIA